MACSRRTHKMSLRKAPVNANKTVNSGTPQLPTTTPSMVAPGSEVNVQRETAASQLPIITSLSLTPQIYPQTNSPLFSLPPELRNRIYDYMYTPANVTVVTASDALLSTCRLAHREIHGIFDRSPASSRFWGHNIFVVNLDDSRYDEYVRLNENYDRAGLDSPVALDLVPGDYISDWPYVSDIYTDLGDRQLTAVKHLIISVKADNGSCKAHLTERTLPCGAKYWYLDQTASVWEGILVPQGHLDEDSLHQLETIVAGNAMFPMPMVQSFPVFRYVGNNPSNLEYFHYSTMAVKETSGSNYMFMKDRREIHRRLQRSRAILEWHLPSTFLRRLLQSGVSMDRRGENVKPKIVKRDQLDIFMEHCWLVFRARKNA